jgi:hypothetical protein
VLPNG